MIVVVLRGEVGVEHDRQPDLAVDDAEQRLAQRHHEHDQERDGCAIAAEAGTESTPAALAPIPSSFNWRADPHSHPSHIRVPV